mgnify:CR=1 FL=1
MPEPRLANEYSMSGWFLFEKGKLVGPWHTGFRVGNKSPPTDDQLGDHTLFYKIGKVDNCVAAATYSYSNMKGDGDIS